ncbi:MAG TPA: type VI secretion system tube protein Hcp [Mucilaginibacter sp.]|jgi:type VI secretion system secreted protein Hcp
MKRNQLYLFVLLILLCQFTALLASAQANQPVIAYVTIEGIKTGQFKGSGVAEGNEGKIECIGFRYSVSVPHDLGSGRNTGKRMHSPLVIIKNIDYATPQLLQAAYTNENLRSVVIEFYKKAADGRTFLSHKITLTNASISLISQYGGIVSAENSSNNNGNGVEEVTLTFQKIEFENPVGNTMTEDEWR